MSFPITVIPHQDFESLLDALIERNWVGPGTSPAPRPIVIPSVPFSDYLQLQIAKRVGVCMGLDLLTSRDFITRATIGNASEAWSKQSLVWRLLPHVDAYSEKLGVSEVSSRDRLALASILADQYDQYSHFRPAFLQNWMAGRSAFKANASAEQQHSETWQRELFGHLIKETRELHPSQVISQLKTDAKFKKQLVGEFPKLLVLGSGVIDPLLVDVLELLKDAGGEIEVHVILPSLEFLGDLKRRNSLPAEDQDPESISGMGGHPLLESMGRHAIGTFLLLGKLDEQYTHWPESRIHSSQPTSLLEHLQCNVRNLIEPATIPYGAADHSLRIHSCFGARREMEVLRDEIWRAFTELDNLQPHEIHIITPSIETYAPLVSAVLEQGGKPLAVRLMELPPGGQDAIIEGILSLLEMAREGRFEASWILALIQLKAVQEALHLSDDDRGLERVREWVQESGLTHGLDRNENRPGSWGFARDRLIAGNWFGPDDFDKYPDGEYVLPVADQLGGDNNLSSLFIQWHSALEEILKTWSQAATPQVWSERLEQACAELLAGADDALLAIQPHLTFLRQINCEIAIDAGTLLDWLQAETQAGGRRTGISGKIAFGRFKQLQNIPCRVLAMVGMQDGAFPGQNRTPSWDLLQMDPRVWDRNTRIDDRQLFLDGLLVPRDRLIITASTRNVRTQKTEPFSSCVHELIRVVSLMGASLNSVVIEHRLQPFTVDYFTEAGQLPPSFASDAAEVARTLEGEKSLKGIPFWSTANPRTSTASLSTITLNQLVEFWKNPAKAFLRAQGITLSGDEADDEELDQTSLSLNHLQSWKAKHSVVQQVISENGNLEHTEALLRANRGLPPDHLGTIGWQASREVGEPLGASLKKNLGTRSQVEVSIEPHRILANVQKNVSQDCLIAFRVGKFDKPKHLLEPWIQAVIASSAGAALPTLLFDEANTSVPQERILIPKPEADAILLNLVQGYFEGQSRPISYAPAASEAYRKAAEKNGPEAGLSAADTEWHKEGNYGNGEGSEPEAKLAWRDRDPFAAPDEWNQWAEAIAGPLHRWEEK